MSISENMVQETISDLILNAEFSIMQIGVNQNAALHSLSLSLSHSPLTPSLTLPFSPSL